MKRPMPIFTAFLILGIIWGSLSLNTPWFLALSFFAFALGFVFFKFFKLKFLILLPCLFALGFILCFSRVNFSDSEYDLFCASGEEVTLSGEVTGTLGSGKIIKTDRNVKIIVYTDRDIFPGDVITLTGKLRALSPQYNPSDFDEIQYYTCRGIYYKMYSPDLEITGRKRTLSYYLFALKTKAAEALDEIYSEENSAILKAMILGDKTYLSDEIKLLYKNSGIYHILAISGLHISLIAGVFMYFFKKKRHSIIIMAFLALYCVFTGLSPSAVRAVIMMWVLLIGRMLGRKYDLVSSLAFSAFLILVFNPLYLFDCGFIYSYCSVLGIALFAKPFGKITGKVPVKNPKFRKHVLDALAASLSAVIITKLVNMYYFYNFTTCDFITNLVVLPSVIAVVISGALSLV
ncbi:MAG: ComEC family competence protein, partial [Clostridiales bacterium]|nr:ComEC family competence protein [Clostridiales bacterium]